MKSPTKRRRTAPAGDLAAQGSLFDSAPEATRPSGPGIDARVAAESDATPEASAGTKGDVKQNAAQVAKPRTHQGEASSTPASTAALGTPLALQFEALPGDWRSSLSGFMETDRYRSLCQFVDGERAAGKTIYPDDPFHALHLTRVADVRVVVIGQDPYHGEDRGIPQAHGLAFSVRPGVRPPPSLRNIFKEIGAEFGHPPAVDGCLDRWARQGVLLLNTVLTVERSRAASHARRGWEACTDMLIARLAQDGARRVFLLWGSHAAAKRPLIGTTAHHLVLEAAHPSPLSAYRGFLGCGCFAEANAWLTAAGRGAIDWS